MTNNPTPNLFLSASGSIGHTVTAIPWKGCTTWRPYSYPARGKTAAQAKVRALFKMGSDAWRAVFNSQQIRDDWNRLAGYANVPMTGYNIFVASAYHARVNDPNAVFLSAYVLHGNHLECQGKTISMASVPSPSQGIDIWIGTNPEKQDYWDTRDFRLGELWTPPFEKPGTYFIRMSSEGIPVSGLIKVTYYGP